MNLKEFQMPSGFGAVLAIIVIILGILIMAGVLGPDKIVLGIALILLAVARLT